MSQGPSGLVIEDAHPSRTLDEASLRALLEHVVAEEDARVHFLSVILTDHDTVRHLNREHLGHDYNTDVLSFPLSEPDAEAPVVDGEIYVDLDTAAERHDEFDTTFEREAFRYAVHGVLHLLGYDDASDAERTAMRETEDRYLHTFSA